MNRAFLGIFLAAHRLWLIDDPCGVRFYAPRANLRGADLRGANRLLGPQRSDGHLFTYCLVENKVRAGCRSLTFAEYEVHIAAEYEGTEKAAETRAILQCLRILVAARSPA